MERKSEQELWEAYRDRELASVTPILGELGFELEAHQPHIRGERYLMQAVTTAHGKKLILLGRQTANGKRVVIKTTSDPSGKQELLHERECRTVLHRISFAYNVFFSPEEVLFAHRGAFIVSVHVFLEQERPFLERPTEEQFTFALKAFKTQESAHAATFEQRRLIERTFGSRDARGYLDAFAVFKHGILSQLPAQTHAQQLLEGAEQQLSGNSATIEQYCGFLTHVDFVPHNFRVVDGNIYLLDHSSLRFGNKYEGWARFINFMALYNPPLARVLMEYVRNNRTEEESVSLRLMRIYRLGEIIWYYTSTLDKTTGELNTLNGRRVEFWTAILRATVEDKPVPQDFVDKYKRVRDSLRSKEEKQRQIGLH